MAFTVKWYWNSGTDDSPAWMEFGDSHIIKMVGRLFDSAIAVNQYQNAMHLQTDTSTDTDACESPHLSNLQYVVSDKAAIRGSYTKILSASFPATTMCLKVVVGDFDTPTSFTTTEGGLFFYDGTTPATAPTDLTVQGLEQEDTSWTSCGGSTNAVSISDKSTPATTQTFYVGISAKPTGTGSLTATLRFTIDYDTGGGAVTLTSDIGVELEATYCDAVSADHILNIIASATTKPIIKQLTARSVDNSYGSSASTAYASPRQIVGLVIPDTGYYLESMKTYGIETKSTPALLVPITCEYEIGSRVYDLITDSWYEICRQKRMSFGILMQI